MKSELIVKIEKSELPQEEQDIRLFKAIEILLRPPFKNQKSNNE